LIAETISALLNDDIPEPDKQAHSEIMDAIEAAYAYAVRRFRAPFFTSRSIDFVIMNDPTNRSSALGTSLLRRR